MQSVNNIVILVVGLVVTAILLGTIFLTGVGTLANGTKGTACVNCQSSTKTLLNNTELILVLSVFLAIIGGAIAVFTGRNK